MADDDSTAQDAAQRAAALLEDSAEDLYEHAPCGYLSCYPDGQIARVNQTLLTWTGYTREELLGGRRFVDLLTAGGRIYHETHYAPLLRMQGSVRAIAVELTRADGSRMPVLINSDLRVDQAGRPLAVRTTIFDATDRKQYETELLAARRRAELAVTRLQVVDQVVADLAAVSDVATVSGVIAGAGITAFGAVGSAVWLVDGDTGAYVHAASSGVGDHRADLPAHAVERYPALREGHVVVVSEGSAGDEGVELRAGLDDVAGSLVLAPLTALGRTLGMLALLMPKSRAAEPEELTLLQTLGRQAGQALERAQLFDVQRMVATTLQHSMLPRSLPDDPRLRVSACYRPAIDGLYVGGDWYDAFRLDDDRIALVVGDVVGRGLQAAAAMGQLRSAVRALATTGAGPGRLLEGLDRFVDGVEAADTATLAYAEVDLRDGSAVFACAGHPPPVLIEGHGRAELLWGGRSAPLGAQFGDPTRPEESVRLTPGARLVLYTDGLVERRHQPLDQSIDHLAEMLGSWTERPFAHLAEGVTDALVGISGTDDDVCLLAVAFGETPTLR